MLHTSNQNMFTKLLNVQLSRVTYTVSLYQTLIYFFHFQQTHEGDISRINHMIDNRKDLLHVAWFRNLPTGHMLKNENEGLLKRSQPLH